MAEIAHAYAEQNPQQSTTSTTLVDAVELASSNFTAGKKYLIVATAQVASSSITSSHRPTVVVLHGSTQFSDSERYATPTVVNQFSQYAWFTVWTAVSGEGIKIQFKTGNAATTAYLDLITLFAMNLSDDVTENTDWKVAESATDGSLSSVTPSSGAAITFTPATAGDKWLVMSLAQISATAATASMASRIVRSGEASGNGPDIILEPFNSTNHQDILFNAWPLTLGAQSNTFTEESRAEGADAHTRLHSRIFALNLSKFRNAGFAYTAAATTDLSTTDFGTEAQTLSYTPTIAGDTWIGAAWAMEKGIGSDTATMRLQVDGSDQPPSQTTNAYDLHRGNDNRDEDGYAVQTVESLTATAHTIDLDVSCPAAGTQTAKHRVIWAVSMELAATASTTRNNQRLLLGVG